MSQFIDNLSRLSRAIPQPIGFGRTPPASLKPKLQLVASLAEESAENLVTQVAGADAGLLCTSKLSSGAQTLQKIAQAIPNIPWGVWLGDNSQTEIEEMLKAGCDFVVFPANTSLTLRESKVGKILAVERTIPEGLLRTINELPIDAAIIVGERQGEFLTWQQLMLFQRFAGLLTKPLLVSIPTKVTAGGLQALWEAGVDGIVIDITMEPPQDRVRELRQIIDQLDFPPSRKRVRVEPVLPRISQDTSVVTTEEEEEEEEED